MSDISDGLLFNSSFKIASDVDFIAFSNNKFHSSLSLYSAPFCLPSNLDLHCCKLSLLLPVLTFGKSVFVSNS